MSKLSDVQYKALRNLLGTRCVSRALVNLQDATATFDSVSEPDGIIRYDIDGVALTVADVTDKVLATLAALQNPVTGRDTYYSQPINTTVYYLWVLSSAGTSYVIQGTYAGQVISRAGRDGLGDGAIPDIALEGYCPVAVFKVVNGATAVWVPATTNWNATNVDAYATPLAVLPSSTTYLTNVIGGA
jgi:hypothetical protein